MAGHVVTIVKANILDEEAAKELTLNAARKLAGNVGKIKGAAPIVPGFMMNADDNAGGFNPLGGAKK